MIFGAVVFGQACFFSSDYAKAKQAAIRIFQLIDSSFENNLSGPMMPQILNNPLDYKLNRCQGQLEFCNVAFSYPGRSHQTILRDISFLIKAGQKIALVGYSGSGKSTLIQLLQRFYEPIQGKIVSSL